MVLTWNNRDSFQSSENSESSQCWDIPKVHKLCDISAMREVTHKKHNDNTHTKKKQQLQTKQYITHRGLYPTANTNRRPPYLELQK